MSEKLIFEKSSAGKTAFSLPELKHENISQTALGEGYLRKKPAVLPEVSELELVRHFTNLSRQNFGVDLGFYPLGSCTMKYNPKINEVVAGLEGFKNLHPLAPAQATQGILELLDNFEKYLSAIFGYDRFTLAPLAGAHGELTAILIIKAYHQSRKDFKRKKILVPDSSHGTNPSSGALVGFEIETIPSDSKGLVSRPLLKEKLTEEAAGLMLTNPNTLGLFEENILEIAGLVHQAGGLLYYDGANANATLGIVRPADLGFDLAHLNLHKTFATPHGGGGPGAGPVGVKKFLEPFLPEPLIIKKGAKYSLEKSGRRPKSIGRVSGFYGNIGVIIKAFAYTLGLGQTGFKKVAETAVLNANYLLEKIKPYYDLPFTTQPLHEFVISARRQKKNFGVSALDIAKRLIDFGFHPPTVYFPLIAEEALMIEPTETESKETLDEFAETLITIAKECEQNPELVKSAPHITPVGRLDEAKAARNPVLRWRL